MCISARKSRRIVCTPKGLPPCLFIINRPSPLNSAISESPDTRLSSARRCTGFGIYKVLGKEERRGPSGHARRNSDEPLHEKASEDREGARDQAELTVAPSPVPPGDKECGRKGGRQRRALEVISPQDITSRSIYEFSSRGEWCIVKDRMARLITLSRRSSGSGPSFSSIPPAGPKIQEPS